MALVTSRCFGRSFARATVPPSRRCSSGYAPRRYAVFVLCCCRRCTAVCFISCSRSFYSLSPQDDDHPPLGVSIDVRDEKGMTPLHWLSVEGHASVVQWLVEEVGATLDLGDARYGQTALHFAASKDRGQVAQQLLELGASTLAADRAGWTPLHTAARAGAVDVANILLSNLPAGGVNAHGPDGQTPLHRAAFWGHTELVIALLNAGATRDKLDARGRSAADVACDGGDRRGELPKLLVLLRSPPPKYAEGA